jgi:hypothetical protein
MDMVIDGMVLSHGSWIGGMPESSQMVFAGVEMLLSLSPRDFDLLFAW